MCVHPVATRNSRAALQLEINRSLAPAPILAGFERTVAHSFRGGNMGSTGAVTPTKTADPVSVLTTGEPVASNRSTVSRIASSWKGARLGSSRSLFATRSIRSKGSWDTVIWLGGYGDWRKLGHAYRLTAGILAHCCED